ncbi:MAG: hypothetical protein L0Z62_29255 [Gemmataceae bacterium]|nr:hypothetical protein [Gemmataceae bacterium]
MSKHKVSLEAIGERSQSEAARLLPNEENPRRAFIAAPASVDTSVLREALQRRGIVPYEMDEVDAPGLGLLDLLDDCVKKADLVVTVLGQGIKDNALVELGYALASKKRVLAIVPPGEDPPLPAVPYLRTLPTNREAIEFGLDRILSVPPGWRPAKKEPALRTKPLGSHADALLRQLHAATPPREQDLEHVVQEALSASGITARNYSAEPTTEDGWADFAIWSDDFEPWVGNPLLIEVRAQLRGPTEREAALAQLTSLLDRTHTGWALLLHGGQEFGPQVEAAPHPRVFVLTIEQFLESLREQSLGELLRRMRNRRVHGKD